MTNLQCLSDFYHFFMIKVRQIDILKTKRQTTLSSINDTCAQRYCEWRAGIFKQKAQKRAANSYWYS